MDFTHINADKAVYRIKTIDVALNYTEMTKS